MLFHFYETIDEIYFHLSAQAVHIFFLPGPFKDTVKEGKVTARAFRDSLDICETQ